MEKSTVKGVILESKSGRLAVLAKVVVDCTGDGDVFSYAGAHFEHKSFPMGKSSLHVLKGIDLEVIDGEIVAIVGPSGVGKSTLLHILGALDRPTEGSVEIDGHDVFELDDGELAEFRNSRAGFVFQFHHLLPELTALENVMLPGLIGGRDRKELERAGVGLLSEVGLQNRASHRPGELSGGEQQRLAGPPSSDHSRIMPPTTW